MLKTNRNVSVGTGSFYSKQPSLFSHQYSRSVGLKPALKCRLEQERGAASGPKWTPGFGGKPSSPCVNLSLCLATCTVIIVAHCQSGSVIYYYHRCKHLNHCIYHQASPWVHTVSNVIIRSSEVTTGENVHIRQGWKKAQE